MRDADHEDVTRCVNFVDILASSFNNRKEFILSIIRHLEKLIE